MALINFAHKINGINPSYRINLDFQAKKTEVGTQKIDNFPLKIYSIVIVVFRVFDKFDCLQFF